MAPTLLFDISNLDLDHTLFDTQAIESINPHRGDMRMLDRIAWADEDYQRIVAIKEVLADEFWVEGHFPTRPLLPGVLMVEAAGQLASLQYRKIVPDPSKPLLGFAGLDAVKFRGQVQPRDRLTILSKMKEFRPRRVICDAQGLVDGTLVFEARVTGMPV